MPTTDMPIIGKTFTVPNSNPLFLTACIEGYLMSMLHPQQLVSKLEPNNGDLQAGVFRVTLHLAGNVGGGCYNAYLDCRARTNPYRPTACDLTIQQRADLDLVITNPEAVENFRGCYAEFFHKDDFTGVLRSINLLRRVVFEQQKLAFEATFKRASDAVTPMMQLRNMNVNKGGKSERVTFSTLIDDELPNTKPIFDLIHTPEANDRGVMVDKWYTKSDTNQYKAEGTFNFVYKSGTFKAGKEIGHYWLSSGGKDITFAGEVTFKKGDLTHWNNRSGHFLPHPAIARMVPFPYDKFEPRHVHQLASAREKERKEKEQAEEALRFWGPIDEYLRNPANRSLNARDVMRSTVTTFAGLSNRKVQDRMLDLELVTDAKTMKWI